jgi:hypothetical protein
MITGSSLRVGKEFINEQGHSLRIMGWNKPPQSHIQWECVFDDGSTTMAQVGTTEEILDFLNFQRFILFN